MTNRNHPFLVLLVLSLFIISCEKQQIEKTAKDLKGTFRITEFNYWFKFYNTTLKRSDSIRVQNVFDLKNQKDINCIKENYDLVFSIHCKQIFPVDLISKLKCINIFHVISLKI